MPNTKKKHYDDDFKHHIAELCEAGQTRAELAKAYDLHPTSVSNWIKRYENSGSFRAEDNRSEE